MGGINRLPDSDDTWAIDRMRAYREARSINTRAERIGENESERQLDELDDAIVGISHRELVALRAEIEDRKREEEARAEEERQKKPRKEQEGLS